MTFLDCHFLTNAMTIPGLEHKNHSPSLFQAMGTLFSVVENYLLKKESSPILTNMRGMVEIIDIEYNKRLDRQRPCLEGDFNGGSNNIVQSNKSV